MGGVLSCQLSVVSDQRSVGGGAIGGNEDFVVRNDMRRRKDG